MRPLRVLIVEDEAPAARRLQLALAEAAGVEVVGVASDGPAGLEMVQTLRPDVVMTDIKMPGVSGLELAQVLSETLAPAIIFVTAYREFAVEAFELAAIDFLTKPVQFSRVHSALERARTRLEETTARQRAADLQRLLASLKEENPDAGASAGRGVLWISEGRRRVRIEAQSIEWLEAERDYVRLHSGAQSHLMRGTLQALADRLAPEVFWRVHRSAMVNLKSVVALSPRAWGLSAIKLASGAEVPVGRSYLAATRTRLGMDSRNAD
ncbi:MAG: LytTR family DNA-binding domain-containing protein [Caulobacteraceae bacterium]|nr:LytTR family DNA-binding domain-containing protein [Caulobacteraceae bacterium]